MSATALKLVDCYTLCSSISRCVQEDIQAKRQSCIAFMCKEVCCVPAANMFPLLLHTGLITLHVSHLANSSLVVSLLAGLRSDLPTFIIFCSHSCSI